MTTKTVQYERLQEYLKRGGKITMVTPGKAYGAQKPQKIKRAYRSPRRSHDR